MTEKELSLRNNRANVNTSRRAFLKLVGGGLSASVAPTLFIPEALKNVTSGSQTLLPACKKQELSLSFYNRHTGESLKRCVFWAEGIYNSSGLEEIDKLFRDHRTQTIHEIDRNLLHVLHKIQEKLGSGGPFHLISGYRSPQTNKALNARSRGVAKMSQHVYGKAADICVPGRTLKQVQEAAKALRAGGVGRYTEFVHVDTGRVRYWGMT